MQIGPDCEIGNDFKAGDDVIVGSDTIIKNNVYIGDNSKIGTDAVIGAGATIGKNCQIAADVIIGEGAVIEDNVVIGSDCKIRPYSVVSSGMQLSSDTIYSRPDKERAQARAAEIRTGQTQVLDAEDLPEAGDRALKGHFSVACQGCGSTASVITARNDAGEPTQITCTHCDSQRYRESAQPT